MRASLRAPWRRRSAAKAAAAPIWPKRAARMSRRSPARLRRCIPQSRGCCKVDSFDGVTGEDGAFVTRSTDLRGCPHEYRSKKVILATGYYDVPNRLNVPGEDLPKVMHYYKEAHPYYNHDVLVVGAKNSAAIAALEL